MIPSDAFVVLLGTAIVLAAILAGVVLVTLYELVTRAIDALDEYRGTL
jgi:hypothetical protein